MAAIKNETSSGERLRNELKRYGQTVTHRFATAGAELRNERRQRRRLYADFVVMPVGGTLPERDGPPRTFWQRRLPLRSSPGLTIETFDRRVQQLIDADNVRGVILLFRSFSAGLASLESFRQAMLRLRAAGKICVVYTPYLDMRHFYLATAADKIIVPPGTRFEVLGLYTDVIFLKDALARIGVQADVIQISPYKTALDRLGQSDMTDEYREQLNWLLDEQFDLLTAAMAEGRGLTQSGIQRDIDEAPFAAHVALEHGLIDHIAYDDELAELLAQIYPREVTPIRSRRQKNAGDGETKKSATRAKLVNWSEASSIMLEKPRKRIKRYVGVITLEGAITMGPSRQPPIELPIPFIGGSTSGEQTLVSLLRKAEKMPDLAAVVLHIDSGGGSALASELIGRQVQRLAEKKPVVVYMSNIAASGGYYVAAPGRHIIAQPVTITGSIGVITGHISTTGLYEMLSVNRVALRRGAHAGLYSDPAPLDDTQREIYWRGIDETYGQFKETVASGRNLPFESLDPICEGRVWTGRQALKQRLVDSHGNIQDAIAKATELAELGVDDILSVPVVNLYARSSGYVVPAAQNSPVPQSLTEMLEQWLAGDRIREWHGRPLTLMPFTIEFK